MSGGGHFDERVDVTTDRPLGPVEFEHRARYEWACAGGVQGKILDIACGTGHGSTLLSVVGTVTGIDRDESAVSRAESRPDRDPAATFIRADVPPIPLEDHMFDLITCFETIEHIQDDEAFVAELARVLRPGGSLLLSSPNLTVSSPEQVENPYHVREYRLGELTQLVERHGLAVGEVFGQSTHAKNFWAQVPRSVAWRLRPIARLSTKVHRLIYRRILDLDVRPMEEADRPRYWVLRCTAKN